MKIFVNKRTTKKQLRSLICKLAKETGVAKIIFNNKGKHIRGSYNSQTKHMYIDLNQTKTSMLHTFFHELGHHRAAQLNKWSKYHFCLVAFMNVETIFTIENKVDQIGEKLWYKYVDKTQWGNYKFSYPKSQKNNIIKNFLSKF